MDAETSICLFISFRRTPSKPDLEYRCVEFIEYDASKDGLAVTPEHQKCMDEKALAVLRGVLQISSQRKNHGPMNLYWIE